MLARHKQILENHDIHYNKCCVAHNAYRLIIHMYVGKNTIHHSIFGRKNEFTLSYKLSPPESAHNEYFELYKKIYTDVICAKYKLWNIVKNKVRFLYNDEYPIMPDSDVSLCEYMIESNRKERDI